MKLFRWLILTVIAGTLVACQPSQTKLTSQRLYLSNLADSASQMQVERVLERELPKEDVGQFMTYVIDYNQTIANTTLSKGFNHVEQPVYDVEKIDQLWGASKGDFIGTNCRINTYTLLKSQLGIPEVEGDDDLLFFDLEAIATGKLLSDGDTQRFKTLFGRVETAGTKELGPHIAKMEEYFSTFTFSEKAHMVSVVFHDNLEGNHLFIGHVGVMVEDDTGVLFVEKLSFQEPYQALKFTDKEAVYDYLLTKYAIDYGQETAPPFIMDNEKVVRTAKKESP